MWHLTIERDGSARVSSSSELGAKSLERRFTVSVAQHQAILAAAEETEFFSLAKSLGPSSIPIHGPQNTLELDVRGRIHRVFLNDPASAEGAQVKRFRRIWRAVVESSPIKPPL